MRPLKVEFEAALSLKLLTGSQGAIRLRHVQPHLPYLQMRLDPGERVDLEVSARRKVFAAFERLIREAHDDCHWVE